MKELVISLICFASLTSIGQNSLHFQLNSTSIQQLNFINPAKGLIPEWRWAEMHSKPNINLNFDNDTLLIIPQDTSQIGSDSTMVIIAYDSLNASIMLPENPFVIFDTTYVIPPIDPWPIWPDPYPIWIDIGTFFIYVIAERRETHPHRIYAYQELQDLTVEALQFHDQICVRIDARANSWMNLSLKKLKKEGIAMPLHTGDYQFNVPQGYHELFFDIDELQHATYLAELSEGDLTKTCRVETRPVLMADELPVRNEFIKE